MGNTIIQNPQGWRKITLSPTWTLSSSQVTKTYTELINADEVIILLNSASSSLHFINVGTSKSNSNACGRYLQSSDNYDDAIDGSVEWATGKVTLREGFKGSLTSYSIVTGIAYRKYRG